MPSATILVSGAESAFRKSESLLKILAESPSSLGAKVAAASALDCAFLSYFAGALLGALHGARICEAEGLRVDEFGSLIADTAPLLGADIKHMGEAIQESKYENPQAALQGWAAALRRIAQHARHARINSDFPSFASALFEKGVAAGYGTEEVASLIKVLRADA